MYNCIFTAHCTEPFCDKSCPMLVETSYLLERNGISMNSEVFYSSESAIQNMLSVLDKSSGKLSAYVVKNVNNTLQDADLLTYCAICKNWQGSRLHCVVYNLRLSKYLDELKKSWSMKSEPESLEYMRIWSESAKVLIISSLDYVNFGDFESQTVLNLIQSRRSSDLTTIFVMPPISQLVSTKSSVFFNKLRNVLSDAVKVVSEW